MAAVGCLLRIRVRWRLHDLMGLEPLRIPTGPDQTNLSECDCRPKTKAGPLQLVAPLEFGRSLKTEQSGFASIVRVMSVDGQKIDLGSGIANCKLLNANCK